ncbi:hypothetical protein A2V49_00510 [candidate division WWE3 bacterium RBG_19FT_COMBO_34_6]|uniref:Uncharacterized protein n=1 Tax=candidate division WWE3 bacterium RBG_19FT_COMBO_34_6 TaxID=1802612 RepID=A0A1F4UNH4_UNCKA|nr:MAG: hypothetical protein A2V49_00510 [candidate division WWE3 bacterium RBG_19FT_COMBO_34_6]
MKPLNILCTNSYGIRRGNRIRRYYVQIEFENSVTEDFTKRFLQTLETKSGTAGCEYKGQEYLYFLKVRVKGYYLLPNGKKLLLSLAPLTEDKYDKYCLTLQIKDVLSFIDTESNLSQ